MEQERGEPTQPYHYNYFRWELDPTHNLNESDIGQLIKFTLKTDQLIDPATAHVLLTVQAKAADYTANTVKWGPNYEGIALDGPSTALISNMKIYSNSRLLEHVESYNHIGQVLSDINMTHTTRYGK